MNRILKNFLDVHKQEYEIQNMPYEKAFEHFVNRCIVNKYSAERFDPQDIMTEEGEKGLDGVAILINSILVFDLDEAVEIMKDIDNIEVRFVFIQSKTSDSFSGSEIGDFIYGVKAFFEEKKDRPQTNNKMESLIKIKDYIFKNSVKLKVSPVLEMYYVACGKWDEGNGLQNRIDIDLKPLKYTDEFSEVNYYTYDSEKIIIAYREMKKKISRKISIEKKVTFPAIAGILQAYMGFVKCKDYVKMLEDNEGNMLTNIFEDNVRDFQGYNAVNSEIKKTILDKNDQARFAVLNNGITIVAKKLEVQGDVIEVFDYQIVNGCQTSYVLFDSRNKLTDESYVMIKLIEVTDVAILDRIVFTTNRQTEVKSEAFIATKPFHKRLQDTFNAINKPCRLYYERRSKQYDLQDDICKNNVVSLASLTFSYVAMFLEEPHSVHRYYGELLRANEKRIYLETDQEDIYYFAAYFNYYIENKIKAGIIEAKYRSFKYYIMCGMKCYFLGSGIYSGIKKRQKEMSKILEEQINSEKNMSRGLHIVLTALDKVLVTTKVEFLKRNRSKEVTNELITAVLSVSGAIKQSVFLRMGDIVQCTVTNVNDVFVYVKVKTEDARKDGRILISRYSDKHIEDLKKEVKLGEIFSAKIMKPEYDGSYGWELAKIY